jgi:hypothetical protein
MAQRGVATRAYLLEQAAKRAEAAAKAAAKAAARFARRVGTAVLAR